MSRQKTYYVHHTRVPSFTAGDSVWLFIPTAGKLEPRWEGEWVVKSVKSPVNVEKNGRRTRVVHTNRLHHLILDLAAQGSTMEDDGVIASGLHQL